MKRGQCAPAAIMSRETITAFI